MSSSPSRQRRRPSASPSGQSGTNHSGGGSGLGKGSGRRQIAMSPPSGPQRRRQSSGGRKLNFGQQEELGKQLQQHHQESLSVAGPSSASSNSPLKRSPDRLDAVSSIGATVPSGSSPAKKKSLLSSLIRRKPKVVQLDLVEVFDLEAVYRGSHTFMDTESMGEVRERVLDQCAIKFAFRLFRWDQAKRRVTDITAVRNAAKLGSLFRSPSDQFIVITRADCNPMTLPLLMRPRGQGPNSALSMTVVVLNGDNMPVQAVPDHDFVVELVLAERPKFGSTSGAGFRSAEAAASGASGSAAAAGLAPTGSGGPTSSVGGSAKDDTATNGNDNGGKNRAAKSGQDQSSVGLSPVVSPSKKGNGGGGGGDGSLNGRPAWWTRRRRGRTPTWNQGFRLGLFDPQTNVLIVRLLAVRKVPISPQRRRQEQQRDQLQDKRQQQQLSPLNDSTGDGDDAGPRVIGSCRLSLAGMDQPLEQIRSLTVRPATSSLRNVRTRGAVAQPTAATADGPMGGSGSTASAAAALLKAPFRRKSPMVTSTNSSVSNTTSTSTTTNSSSTNSSSTKSTTTTATTSSSSSSITSKMNSESNVNVNSSEFIVNVASPEGANLNDDVTRVKTGSHNPHSPLLRVKVCIEWAGLRELPSRGHGASGDDVAVMETQDASSVARPPILGRSTSKRDVGAGKEGGLPWSIHNQQPFTFDVLLEDDHTVEGFRTGLALSDGLERGGDGAIAGIVSSGRSGSNSMAWSDSMQWTVGADASSLVPGPLDKVSPLDLHDPEAPTLLLNSARLQQVPERVWRYTSLQVLSLCSNPIAELPSRIANLSSLRTLRLAGTALYELPDAVNRLTGLQSLDCSRCRFSAFPGEALAGLTSLRDLSMAQNRLRSLPAGPVGSLTGLRSLVLAINPLRSLPASFGRLVQLEHLDLSHCDLKGALPVSVCRLPQLAALRAPGARLRRLPSAFAELESLRSCELSQNDLREFPDAAALRLTALKSLAMKGNRLARLPDQWGPGLQESLFELAIPANRLTSLGSLGQLTMLERLYGWRNRLTRLPDSFGQLRSLVLLDLSWNRLRSLPSDMGSLVSLRICQLSHNELVDLPGSLCSLTELMELSLAANRLRMLPAKIGRMGSLRSLMLNRNALRVLPRSMAQLDNLQQLDVGSNELDALPVWLGALTSLRQLTVYGNRVAQIEQVPASLGALQALELFNASYCGLHAELPVELDGMPCLHSLHLDGCGLMAMPVVIRALPSLTVLSLSNNAIGSLLDPDFGASAATLTSLRLDGNQLRRLSAALFQLTRLAELNLAHNLLNSTGPSDDDWLQLGRLVDLDLSDNLLRQFPGSLKQMPRLHLVKFSRNATSGPSKPWPGSVVRGIVNNSVDRAHSSAASAGGNGGLMSGADIAFPPTTVRQPLCWVESSHTRPKVASRTARASLGAVAAATASAAASGSGPSGLMLRRRQSSFEMDTAFDVSMLSLSGKYIDQTYSGKSPPRPGVAKTGGSLPVDVAAAAADSVDLANHLSAANGELSVPPGDSSTSFTSSRNSGFSDDRGRGRLRMGSRSRADGGGGGGGDGGNIGEGPSSGGAKLARTEGSMRRRPGQAVDALRLFSRGVFALASSWAAVGPVVADANAVAAASGWYGGGGGDTSSGGGSATAATGSGGTLAPRDANKRSGSKSLVMSLPRPYRGAGGAGSDSFSESGRWLGWAEMQGRRPTQEDAIAIVPKFRGQSGSLFIGLFDGHAGPSTAQLSAQMMPHILEEILNGAEKAASKTRSSDADGLSGAGGATGGDGKLPSKYVRRLGSIRRQGRSATARNRSNSSDGGGRRGSLSDLRSEAFMIANESCTAGDGLTLAQVTDAFREAFDRQHKEVLQRGFEDGAAAVCAQVTGNGQVVRFAHAGDSRAALYGVDGSLLMVTKDHKPDNRSETERIRAVGGFVSENGRVNGMIGLARAIGDRRATPMITCEPDISCCMLNERPAMLVVACDGLFDVCTTREVFRMVADVPDACRAAMALRDAAFAYGSTDNISVVVVHLNGWAAARHAVLSRRLATGRGRDRQYDDANSATGDKDGDPESDAELSVDDGDGENTVEADGGEDEGNQDGADDDEEQEIFEMDDNVKKRTTKKKKKKKYVQT